MHRLIALAALLSAFLSGAAAVAAESSPPVVGAAPSLDTRDQFLAALAAFRYGDWGVAAREFGNARLTTTPLAPYALLFQAECQLRLGNPSAARTAALQVIDANRDMRLAPSAFLQAATLLSDAGDEATATGLFRRFLDRYGDHRDAPRAQLSLGQTLLADGHAAEAARAFSDLGLQWPTAAEAATAAEQLKILEGRGVSGPPVTPRERVERAERVLAAGMSDKAKSEADALLAGGLPVELQPRAFKVLLDVARRSGRPDAVVSTINRALSSLPDARRAPWLLELGRAQLRRARDVAFATLDRLVRQYPKSAEAAEAQLLKARTLEDTGRPADAETVYNALVAGFPDSDETGTALWRLGWLAWFRGDHADAASTWTRLFTARGGQAHREAATYWVGRAEESRGQADLAGRRFLELQSDTPRSYYGILAGDRPARGNRPAAATPAVSLPIDPLEPLRGDPWYARIEALRVVGLDPFADEEMAEMTRRAANDPKLLYAISGAYAQDSRHHLALRILRRHFLSLARSGAASAPRAFWEMFYPLGWRSELIDASTHASIDPFLVAAVVREESSFYPHARSRVGARGLMQLMPETARPMATARRLPFNDGGLLDDPGANLQLGSAFLASLLREFGDARLAAAAYNAGPNRVREWWGARRSDDLDVWVEQIPFNETRAFVKRVMTAWEEYRRLYGASVAAGAPDERGPW